MTQEEEVQAKRIEYFSATTNAWYNSALEHDKSLLTLSTGGIGFLITILATTKPTDIHQLVLYAVAILSFLVCLFSILRIFQKNKTYLENIIQGNAQPNDPHLALLDNIAFYSFFIGVFSSVTVSIFIAFNQS